MLPISDRIINNSRTKSSPRPAIFLDRDGTIIELRDYLRSLAEIVLLPRAAEGLKLLADAGYLLIIITNQSGVARGYFDENFVRAANAKLNEMLARRGVVIDAVYYCPHHPQYGPEGYRVDCDCRKPKPGMISKAAADFDIDLRRSWVIGDNEPDIKLAANAGLRSVLVRTGYGGALAAQEHVCANIVAADLYEAAERIISGNGES